MDTGKVDYKTKQSLTKYIKTDSNTMFVLPLLSQWHAKRGVLHLLQ